MAAKSTPLDDDRYISLETFRKDGTGVKTPVWAAPLDGKMVIFTEASSFKVKRLRQNPKVRAAACGVRGKVHGPWLDGECRIVEDPASIERILAALGRKYGWQMSIGNVLAKLAGKFDRRAYLEVTIQGT
ncbi:MAG: PPOX class F420-dependent oxidoreductase [Myxococcales bacterium]|nr:PPOX class F420-dependent oxidoreductase [Myxococcales bacterium]